MNLLNIDPDLPTLPLAFDGDAVSQRFEDEWPSATVKRCRRQSVQYVPTKSCVTTHKMMVEQSGAAPVQTIGVVEVNPSGLEHRLFTEDTQLPGLSTAINVNEMRNRLMGLVDGNEQIDSTQTQLDVTPVRYKPGSRCTFRYDFKTERAQKSLFGKILAKDGAQLAETASNLYQASQEHPELPRISLPLAYWPELQMVIQAAVPGEELHDLAFDPQVDIITRIDWLRAAGRSTAALHNYTDIEGPQQTFAGDLADLDQYRPALLKADPELTQRFDDTIAMMLDATRHQTELASVVSHGALRTDQFMIDGNQLVLIDLDGICWSSPARDLGNMFAYLMWKTLRQPQHAAFIQQAQRAFLEGYSTLRTLPNAEWMAFYQTASVLKIIGRRYSNLNYREWPLTEQLLEMAVKRVDGIQ